MAAFLTPGQFAAKYRVLYVHLDPQELSDGPPPVYTPPVGWRQVKVENYLLQSYSSWADEFWHDDVKPHFKDPVTVRVRPINKVGVHEDVTFTGGIGASLGVKRDFDAPFLGKGSPEQIQIAIQLLYRFRRVKLSLDAFVGANFIGLDCNGFVGNYCDRVVLGTDWKDVRKVSVPPTLRTPGTRSPGPTTTCTGLFEFGAEVKDPADLKAEGTYILAMCDRYGTIADPGVTGTYGHVMLTEPNTLKGAPGSQTITVVEATPPKLRTAYYTIKSASKGVFSVERGSPSSPMLVRISRLKV
jgi:hypothetical protein